MKHMKKTMVILGVLLVLAVVYIIASQIQAYNLNKTQNVFQAGAEYGYQTAVGQLMGQLATCEPVPVFADNVTLNAIAIECLQQQPQIELPVEETPTE